ncbi:MAG: hypothetical protein JST58_20585 [Bacteroidetes bacterium]|nr:hypothetical protein [Bacteroidota bacterium]
MKTKFTLTLFCVAILCMATALAQAQTCTLTASATTTPSQCKATGSITINTSNGSGNYNYTITGPSYNSITSINVINGLQAGTYVVIVKDISSGCADTINNIVVGGDYQDPRFTLSGTYITCNGGNDGTITVGNIQYGTPPFAFTIISPSAFGVGTTSSTGAFTNLPAGDYTIQMSDSCGGLQTRIITLGTRTWNITGTAVTKFTCDSATVALTVTDSYGNTNTSGTNFTGYLYGYIKAPADTIWLSNNTFNFYKGIARSANFVIKDPCGNIQLSSWTDNKTPTANANVALSNQTCSSFTASIAGQQNLTSPQYCLYDANNNQISCNTTGVFNSIAYGSYCIKITDNCYDTSFQRCFTASQPKPSISKIVTTQNSCNSMNATVNFSNVTNGQFCLYDASNTQIACNSTGVFSNIPYGSYCVHLQNDPTCFDTLIVKCFTVSQPPPAVGSNISFSYSCNTFTATVNGQSNLTNPQYCLYDVNNNQISCNSTGQFGSLAYGSYCIKITNDPSCYDSTITRCFTVTQPKPAVSNNPNIVYACNSFSASITGQQNLTNPQYCLYDASNNQISCNSTGQFTSIPFGSYCIHVINDPSCYDTTITVCFSASAPTLSATVTTGPNCVLGTTGFGVTVSNGIAPYTIKIYDPSGVLINTTVSSNKYTPIYNVPTPTFANYSVVVAGACGSTADTVIVGSYPSVLTKTIKASTSCPGDTSLYGLGQISFSGWVNWGNGSIWPVIISQNNNPVYIQYSSIDNSGAYIFSNLSPSTYVIQTWTTGCSSPELDTVTINPYQYPSMNQSAIYQCNDNSFSVNAAATGGIAPYSYSIIGSTPSTPSLIQGPQASPTFNIGSGTAYSVVRLRAVDACGNATLDDASILPLGNTIVSASSNCSNTTVVLSVDTIPNATYSWYRKTTATDSTLIGTDQTYTIQELHMYDTGIYVSVVKVNDGCLTRITEYDLTGNCGGILPLNDLSLSGSLQNNNVLLHWNTSQYFGANSFIVERSSEGQKFTSIGTVITSINNNISASQYYFTDVNALYGKNFYRLRMTHTYGQDTYSQIISVNKGGNNNITVVPNPVGESFTIQFQQCPPANYSTNLISPDGRRIMNAVYTVSSGESKTIQRTSEMAAGVYFLTILNQTTHESQIIKLLFK